MATAFHVDIL